MDSLEKAAEELHGLVRQINHAVAKKGVLEEHDDLFIQWVITRVVLLLRWLGEPSECRSHFHPTSQWQQSPGVEVAEAFRELPSLLEALHRKLHNILFPNVKKAGSDRLKLTRQVVFSFLHHQASLESAFIAAAVAVWRLRNHSYQQLLAWCRSSDLTLNGDSTSLLPDLPVAKAWAHPPGCGTGLEHLAIPIRSKLEPLEGVASSFLRLSIFAQVGCDDDVEADQWESFVVRVHVSVLGSCPTPYTGLVLGLMAAGPTCDIKSVRSTVPNLVERWLDNDSHETVGVEVELPPLDGGNSFDLLLLGSVRVVGLLKLTVYVGAAPWGRSDHRRLRESLASACGISLAQLRLVEVGEVDDDGCAKVVCAFPEHPRPRVAQTNLIDIINSANQADFGFPNEIREAIPAQPSAPDICASLQFRVSEDVGEAGKVKPKNGKVAFSCTTDIQDSLAAEICLAERWGHHSARVREEVFRQNLCTVFEREDPCFDGEAAATKEIGERWKKKVLGILGSPLYDVPASELRDTPLAKDLYWTVAGGEVDIYDPGERRAIIESMQLQRHVPNREPQCSSRGHQLFINSLSTQGQLHRAVVDVFSELVRMEPVVQLAVECRHLLALEMDEEAERRGVLAKETTAWTTLLKKAKRREGARPSSSYTMLAPKHMPPKSLSRPAHVAAPSLSRTSSSNTANTALSNSSSRKSKATPVKKRSDKKSDPAKLSLLIPPPGRRRSNASEPSSARSSTSSRTSNTKDSEASSKRSSSASSRRSTRSGPRSSSVSSVRSGTDLSSALRTFTPSKNRKAAKAPETRPARWDGRDLDVPRRSAPRKTGPCLSGDLSPDAPPLQPRNSTPTKRRLPRGTSPKRDTPSTPPKPLLRIGDRAVIRCVPGQQGPSDLNWEGRVGTVRAVDHLQGIAELMFDRVPGSTAAYRTAWWPTEVLEREEGTVTPIISPAASWSTTTPPSAQPRSVKIAVPGKEVVHHTKNWRAARLAAIYATPGAVAAVIALAAADPSVVWAVPPPSLSRRHSS
eukprot:Sspe_Gene.33229::Locus_16238_Transcript_1_1_Confidence_1.000_Length_3211::g.33229::m.33229